MKLRTLVLSTAILATATGYAFAQTPTERTGSKTEQGTQMQQDNKMGGGMNKTTGSGMTSGTTSGSGMGPSTAGGSGATGDKANGPMMNKNTSPGSMESGEKQQK